MASDREKVPVFQQKEDPRTKTKEYRELEKILEKFEDHQKINYLKKRLTNHVCSIFIETHPELGLVANEDPKLVSELQKRIHRINKLLDDSPLYSPFLRGIKTDKYIEPGWSRRQKFAKPYIEDIKILTRKIDGKKAEKEPTISEIKLSDMIYDVEDKKKKELLPEVYILRGLYYLLKIQKIKSIKFADDKLISQIRANHGNYRYALRHLATGIYNGGFSLFSVITFGAIFDKYVQNFRSWLRLEMIAIQFSGRLEVENLRSKVDRHDATLKNIRKNSKSVAILRRMYHWFPDDYRYSRIKTSHIRAAIRNHNNKKYNKKVHGIITRQVITLFINLVTFLAGSPLMRLGLILSRELNSNNPDIILQQRLINSSQKLNNFYRMLGLGVDSQKGKQNSYKLLLGIVKYCDETIERYLRHKVNMLERIYERDPFIKIFIAISHYLQTYPEDKNAREILHNFKPQAERLLKASVKSNHISTALTLVQHIQTSEKEHKEV